MKSYYDRKEKKCIYKLPPETESNYSNSEYESELEDNEDHYSSITEIDSIYSDKTSITNGSTEIMSRAPESYNINERQTRQGTTIRLPKRCT